MCIRDSPGPQNRQSGPQGTAACLPSVPGLPTPPEDQCVRCLLYTSDAADERSSVDLGGRSIITKKKREKNIDSPTTQQL